MVFAALPESGGNVAAIQHIMAHKRGIDMASAFSVDIRPTRRRPGYMAIVWSGWTTDRRVRQVFFGQRYDEVRADAEYYVRAVGGKGVES